jgi:hypothetical protein
MTILYGSSEDIYAFIFAIEQMAQCEIVRSYPAVKDLAEVFGELILLFESPLGATSLILVMCTLSAVRDQMRESLADRLEVLTARRPSYWLWPHSTQKLPVRSWCLSGTQVCFHCP